MQERERERLQKIVKGYLYEETENTELDRWWCFSLEEFEKRVVPKNADEPGTRLIDWDRLSEWI